MTTSILKKAKVGDHHVDPNGWIPYCIKIKEKDMKRIEKIMKIMAVERVSTFLREMVLNNLKDLEEVLLNENN